MEFRCYRLHSSRLTTMTKGIELGLMHKINNKRNMENRTDEGHSTQPTLSSKIHFSLGHSSRNCISRRAARCGHVTNFLSWHKCCVQIPFSCFNLALNFVSLNFSFSWAGSFWHLNRLQEHMRENCSKIWSHGKNGTKIPR